MDRVKGWVLARPGAAEALVVACLVAFYLGTTLPNIANNPILGGDEGWIISGSAKLAEQGTFGTDLFAGFFKAESSYYFNLPLHHLVLAGVFEVFGVGVAQARLVSAAFGLAALALTWALGRRVGGPVTGIGAAALLVLLRLNLTPFTGLTLTDLGATVRYDLIALPFALASALALLRRPDVPSFGNTAAAGLLLGLGCLTQFIDAFFALPFLVFLGGTAVSRAKKLRLVAVFVVAVVLPFLPYFVYIGADWHDFRAQGNTTLQRTDVASPSFYLDNLRDEPDRYNLGLDLGGGAADVLRRPSARLAILILGPAAALYAAVRARRGSAPHRLLALTFIAVVLELALFESTKHFVYWVTAVPFLCIALSDAALGLWRWRPRELVWRRFALAAAAVCGLVIATEGIAVGARNVRDARDAPRFSAAGDAVRAVVPAGSVVLTDNRMWPALRDMQPRSLLLLFYWTNPDIAGERLTDIAGAIERTQARYILLSPLSRELLTHLSPGDSAQFDAYLGQHGTLTATVSPPGYGPIEIYELDR